MTLMQYVIALMESCPHIVVDAPMRQLVVNADGIGKDADSYGVEGVPGDPLLKPYLGGALKQYPFSLTARKVTSTNAEKVANAALYEKVAGWMEQQTRFRKLPPMSEGRQPTRLEAMEGGYLLEAAEDIDSGLYAMQCRLIYHEKVRKA